MRFLSAENTPILVKCLILQIAVRLHDLSVLPLINIMLVDMNAIQTELTAQLHTRAHTQTQSQSNNDTASNGSHGIKIPKTESPVNSQKIEGNLDLAFCKKSCAEYLFEGILGTLSYLLSFSFPTITKDVVENELKELRNSSKVYKNYQNIKMSKNNHNFGKNEFQYRNSLSDEAGREHDRNVVLNSNSEINEVVPRWDEKLNRKSNPNFSPKKSDKKKSVKNQFNENNGNGNGENGSDQIYRNRDREIMMTMNGDGVTQRTSSNTTYKNNVVDRGASRHVLSMEGRVQFAECVIILFDTLMTENGFLFHTPTFSSSSSSFSSSSSASSSSSLFHPHQHRSGQFNTKQCEKLLHLCISVNIILNGNGLVNGNSKEKNFLLPERAASVTEILKSIVNHVFDLHLKYLILQQNTECSRIICKTALSTTVHLVLKYSDFSEKAEIGKTSSRILVERNIELEVGDENERDDAIKNGEIGFSLANENDNENNNNNTDCLSYFKNDLKTSKNDLRLFTNELEMSLPLSEKDLRKSALYQVFQEFLLSATNYLESGGPILTDIDGNSVIDTGAKHTTNNSLSKLSAFELWLNGGARYITTALGLLTQSSFSSSSTSCSTSTSPASSSSSTSPSSFTSNLTSSFSSSSSSLLSSSSSSNFRNNNNTNNETQNYGFQSSQNTNTNNNNNDVTASLFHIFIALLNNDVENIRRKTKNVQRRTAKVEVELLRVQRNQNALHILGASGVCLRLIGISHGLNRITAMSSCIPPLALKLGSSLVSRNNATQNSIMDTYKKSQQEIIGGEKTGAGASAQISIVINGIQKLLKTARSHIDAVRIQGPRSLNSSSLKVLIQIFSFCGMLCSGHNSRARHFLREQDYNVDGGVGGGGGGIGGGGKNKENKGVNYDIVKEIALAVNSLLSAASSIMKYVNNNHFKEFLAPLEWEANISTGRRRYIAWHDKKIDFYVLSQLIHTASVGFSCLTDLSQGPCVENQRSVLLGVTKCQSLLEFLGEFIIIIAYYIIVFIFSISFIYFVLFFMIVISYHFSSLCLS